MNNKKGMTLVTVIAIFSICLLLIVALIGITTNAYNRAIDEFNSQQAYETAHSVSEYIGTMIAGPDGYNNYKSEIRKTIDAVPVGTAPTKVFNVSISKDGNALDTQVGSTKVGMYRFDNGDGLPPELRVLVTTIYNDEERSLLTRYQGNAPGGTVNPEVAKILMGYSIYTNSFRERVSDSNHIEIPIDNLEPEYYLENDPTPEIVEDNQYIYNDYIKNHYVNYNKDALGTSAAYLYVTTYDKQNVQQNVPLKFNDSPVGTKIDENPMNYKNPDASKVTLIGNNYSKKVFEFSKQKSGTSKPLFRVMSHESAGSQSATHNLQTFYPTDNEDNPFILGDYKDSNGNTIAKHEATYPIKIKTKKVQMYPWIVPETPSAKCPTNDEGEINTNCVLPNDLSVDLKYRKDKGEETKELFILGASNKPIKYTGSLWTGTKEGTGSLSVFIKREPSDPHPELPIKVEFDNFQMGSEITGGILEGLPYFLISNEKLEILIDGESSFTAFMYLPNSTIEYKIDSTPKNKLALHPEFMPNNQGSYPNVAGGIVAQEIILDTRTSGNKGFEMTYFQPRDAAAVNLKVTGGYLNHSYIKTGTGKVID
ncbi:MAG: hypothetical protein RR646_03490 [Erysipelotrichaceae bacterium]